MLDQELDRGIHFFRGHWRSILWDSGLGTANITPEHLRHDRKLETPRLEVKAPSTELGLPSKKCDEPRLEVDEPSSELGPPSKKGGEPRSEVDEPSSELGARSKNTRVFSNGCGDLDKKSPCDCSQGLFVGRVLDD